jgi:integrase
MAVTVNRLKADYWKSAPDGLHNDGAGLCLQVKGNARSYVFRYKDAGKIKTAGLGSAATVTLADARKAAAELRAQREQGLDPINQRKLDRAKAKAAEAEALAALLQPDRLTFGQAADEVVKAKLTELKRRKHGMQWSVSLGTTPYDTERLKAPADAVAEHIAALNRLRAVPVADVSTRDVEEVLRPIWRHIPETADRTRARIAYVLDAAIVHGDRTAANVARYVGHLAHILPRPRGAGDTHFASMPVEEAPAFVQGLLSDKPSTSALALAFLILTACRSGELRGMTWSEVDGDVWTVPAERMKMGKQHRAPLSAPALEILTKVKPYRVKPSAFVFQGMKGGALSDMALTSLLRRLEVGCTAHGFRSTFRSWAADEGHPRDLAEMALAHVVGSAVERAYQRSDVLERRRGLMQAWAEYLLKTG